MILDLISFAFQKNKLPGANYLIDVRFLNNPFYMEKLRDLSGLDQEVINFFRLDNDTNNFLKELFRWIEYIIEINKKADIEKIVVAIGCTGGQHRSPYIAESLAKHIVNKKLVSEIAIYHNELSKYNVCIPE